MQDEPLKVVAYYAFNRPARHARAACRGADQSLFFLERGGDSRPAKALCESCPVRPQCADAALSHDDTLGIWGGQGVHAARQAGPTTEASGLSAVRGSEDAIRSRPAAEHRGGDHP